MMQFFRRLILLAFLVPCLHGCGGEEPELTPREKEQGERDALLNGIRARSYRALRSAVPEGAFQAEGKPDDSGFAVAAVFLALKAREPGLFELEQVDPDHLSLARRRELRALRGMAYLGSDWPTLAEEEFRAVIESEGERTGSDPKLDPTAMAHYGLAALSLRNEDSKQVEEHINAAEALGQETALSESFRALNEAQQGEHERALERWARFLDKGEVPDEVTQADLELGAMLARDVIRAKEMGVVLLVLFAAVYIAESEAMQPVREKVQAWCKSVIEKLESASDRAKEPSEPEQGS